jgi:hypothetical protein
LGYQNIHHWIIGAQSTLARINIEWGVQRQLYSAAWENLEMLLTLLLE